MAAIRILSQGCTLRTSVRRGFASGRPKPPPLSVAMANATKMIGTKKDEELVHKRMVGKLQEEGYNSPLMDRISEKVTLESHVGEQEQELLQEIAQSLGRTESKLLFSCLALEVAGKHTDDLVAKKATAPQIREAVDAFNSAREIAVQRRHDLTVHRQACGFRTNSFSIMDEIYPILPKRSPDNKAVGGSSSASEWRRGNKREVIAQRINQLSKAEWEVFQSKPRLERHSYILELLEQDEENCKKRPADLLNRAPTADELKPKPVRAVNYSPGRVIL